MTDATLPPPRSSINPASEGRERSNSSQSREEFDVSGEQNSDPAAGEGASGESESRAENKQRRKRTRYVFILLLRRSYSAAPRGRFISFEAGESHNL
jgi:hypothetical protein